MKPFPSLFMAPPSPHLLDSVATAFIQDTRWTFEQDKLFEQALALLSDVVHREEDSDDGRWRKVAAMVPGKSTAEVKQHYLLLLEDLASIEAGRIALPNYYSCASPQTTTNTTSSTWEDKLIKKPGGAGGAAAAAAAAVCHYGAKAAKPSEQERKKGIPWTEDEHRLFLLGLDKFGKGDWRSISRNFVVSRTPTQVASHAQKYFIRLNSINKDKRRSSIHDITTAAAAAAASPSSSSAADSSCQRPSSSLVPAAAAPPPPPPPSPPILLQTFAQPPPSLSRPPLYVPPLAIAAAPLHLSSPPPYAPPRPQPHPPQFSSLMSGSVSPSRLAFSPHHHSAMHHQ